MNPPSHCHRRRLARRAARALTGVAAAAAATLSLTAAPALAEDCPNAALRAQNNSTQLPGCRAYEQVTPEFKEGFPASPTGFTDDGRLIYISNGSYANNGNGAPAVPGGNTYLAVRAGSGWSNKALSPPGPDYYIGAPVFARALSSDLRSSLWLMRRGDETNDVRDFYVRHPDDVFTRVGSALDPLAPASAADRLVASDDLSHIVFSVGSDGTYEYVGTGDDQPRLVSVDNAGQRLALGCVTSVGGGNGFGDYHAMSTDGRVIFWVPACAPPAVYARVDGTTTIQVSKSQCTRAPSDPGGDCNAPSAPVFESANANGTRVYFTTSQQLVNADTDSTTDLYECDIPSGTPAPVGAVNPCPDLREVSGAADGADVQGVTRMSDDGSRVYFVAKGVLASNTGANDVVAGAGDDNLYVWQRDTAHPAGDTRFVAKVDPSDSPVPNSGANFPGLWSPDGLGRVAQTTDDGRYLVFATHAPLIDHGPQADTDTARDLYRYDAETGALTRLSTEVDGAGGNEPGQDAQITPNAYDQANSAMRRPRTVMSDDGGSVVFTTKEALALSDTNSTPDTYLWHEGRVSLISSGKPSIDDTYPGSSEILGTNTKVQALISPSGRDVYFTTTARLVSGDIDTVFDVYDARVDGGFAPTPTPTPCSGEACQSLPSTPPPASTPRATSSTGQDGPPQTTPAFSVKALTAGQLGRIASTGKVSLSVTTNAPGTLSAQATATIAQRSSGVGSAKRQVAKAGTVSLSLTLSKKARAELKRKRKLTVKVLVGQDNVAIARTVSLKLTSRHAAAKGGRS
jgi:hypothetical protein